MLAFAVIALVLSAALFYASTRKSKRADRLLTSETTTVPELVTLAREIAVELGGGAFEKQVSISGTLAADAPLQSPLTGKPCAWYHLRVVHEYEEPESVQPPPTRNRASLTKGAAPKHQRRVGTRRGPTRNETITETRESAAVSLSVQETALALDLDRAEIELAPTYEIFLPGRPAHGVLTHGAFTIQVGAPQHTRHTRGFRLTERILPLHEEVHAHGLVSDAQGELRMHYSENTPLVLTSENRDTLIRRHQKAARNLKLGAAIAVAASVALALGHFLS